MPRAGVHRTPKNPWGNFSSPGKHRTQKSTQEAGQEDFSRPWEGRGSGDSSLWPGTAPVTLSSAGWLEQVIFPAWGGFQRYKSFAQPQEGSLGLPGLCLQTTDHPARDEAASAASTQVLQHFKPTLMSHSAGDVSQKVFQQRRGK